MTLPNVSHVLGVWSSIYRVKTITRQTVDYVDADVVTGRNVAAVVQPADKTKLNADNIDWSLRYLLIHSAEELADGELIVYQGEDYKIIADGDWQLYGHSEVLAEQTKRPLVAET